MPIPLCLPRRQCCPEATQGPFLTPGLGCNASSCCWNTTSRPRPNVGWAPAPLHRQVRLCAGNTVASEANIIGLRLDPDIRGKALQAAYDLKSKGWAVVEGVLPESTCDRYVEGLWAWLESLGTGVDRHSPETWRSPAWPSAFRGIINTLAVSHQPFVWHVRKQKRLRQVFAALWGTNELLSSFDSINCSPPRVNGSGGASWVHTDQGPSRQGPICIQGLVNMADTSAATTGTLLLKDGSHHAHARFWQEVCQIKDEAELAKVPDFYVFNELEASFYEQFPTVTPDGPAGSLFLWDSRTAHANVAPEVSSDFRHVVYTCFQPKAFATPEDLELKRTAYEDFRVTTHWPAYNVALFPEGGSEYYEAYEEGGAVPRHASHHDRGAENDAVLRQLAGVEPYAAGAVQQAEPLLDLSCEELQSRLRQL